MHSLSLASSSKTCSKEGKMYLELKLNFSVLTFFVTDKRYLQTTTINKNVDLWSPITMNAFKQTLQHLWLREHRGRGGGITVRARESGILL